MVHKDHLDSALDHHIRLADDAGDILLGAEEILLDAEDSRHRDTDHTGLVADSHCYTKAVEHQTQVHHIGFVHKGARCHMMVVAGNSNDLGEDNVPGSASHKISLWNTSHASNSLWRTYRRIWRLIV